MSSDCIILIVDDSAVDRATYRRYLSSSTQLSCQILDCDSAEAVLTLCRRDCPDVILLDYLLPDIDGIELLQILAQHLTTLPTVIMLTGQGNESVAVAAMRQGARDYLIKGELTQQKLINSVVNALTERHLALQIDRQRQQRELLASIALKISHSVDLSHILQSTVEGAQILLNCDRTLIFRLNSDYSGTIVAESVTSKCSVTLGNRIVESCLQDELISQAEKYLQGHRMMIADIELAHLTTCHLEMLQRFQVKAVLATPILCRDATFTVNPQRLWGLLIAHHCETVHNWDAEEQYLLDELSMQMAIAIQQTELMDDLRATLVKQRITEQELSDRILEIEQINFKLSEATQLLEIRNQDLDDFAYIASHDLQTPLRGISNLTKWFVKDLEIPLSLEKQHQLTLIQSRISHMEALIQGLLQYARLGKENIARQSVNLKILLEEVIELIAPPREFEIIIPRELPTIETEALLLKQVLSNLISNAIKHHDRRNGKIQIALQVHSSYLQFTIGDDGPGISEKNHRKIFDIFQTLVGDGQMKGTGIGLAIIKKIVEARGGSVWLESEIGKGSQFHFTWILENLENELHDL